MNEVAESKLEQANAVAAALIRIPGIDAVALFGSVARGDPSPKSDIDLLALTSDQSMTPSVALASLPIDHAELPVALGCYTQERLSAYLLRWSRFGAHLRQEALILYDDDDRLRTILARDVEVSTEAEIAAQRRHLTNYDHLARFGGRYLFPLAGLHRIGRSVTFAVLAEEGILEFDRHRAFAALERLHPERAVDVHTVERLEPFSTRTGLSGDHVALPFEPVGCIAEVQRAREAVNRLLSLSRHAR